MKETEFLTIFFCALLIFQFTSSLSSAKPPQAETRYGEATFVNGTNIPKIIADGSEPYRDIRLDGGEDQIEVELNRGQLASILAVFGRHCMVCWDPDDPDACPHSTRGVIPDFSISSDDVVYVTSDSTEGKMLDALMEALGGIPPDSIYRFRVRVNQLGQDWQIRVDSVIWGADWEKLRDEKGIGEEELIKYYFFSGPDCISSTLDDNTLQYNLRYEGANIVEVTPGETWTIEPTGQATLYVFKGQGNKKGKPNVYIPVDLVTYTNGLPFKIQVTIPDPAPAPGRSITLTTCWGNIKGN